MRLSIDLNADYGAFKLAARGDFTIGGVSALFGPSGAGKTTVLQAIAGFKPDLGRIEADDTVWQGGGHSIPPHRRPVGFVFQDARLFDHLSVSLNLRYAHRRADREGPSILFDEVVETLEVASLLDRSPNTLSGGETQRVAIARSLLTRPRLMLMDEPLAALDRERKSAILAVIAELPRRFEVPVVFVSHLVEEIAQVADQLIAIREGQIVGQGPTAGMLDKLGAELTGHFEAGSLLEGEVAGHDEEYALTAIEVGGGRLWAPGASHVAVGERVRVRLRARDVSVALAPLDGVSIRNQLPAAIVSIDQEEGPHAELKLDCEGQAIRARLTRLSVAELGLAPGQKVWALVKSVAFDRRLG